MERLSEFMRFQAKTIRENNCTTMSSEKADEIADRLAYYEDLEEQGRLVVLPCKVRDKLFFVLDGKIYRATVRFLRWEHHKDRGVRSDITANITPYSTVGASFEDFGKTVFLSREEAENALNAMKEDA